MRTVLMMTVHINGPCHAFLDGHVEWMDLMQVRSGGRGGDDDCIFTCQ